MRAIFPGFGGEGDEVRSPLDRRYNCIAFAAGDESRWWWPGPEEPGGAYWPEGLPRETTLDNFRNAFRLLGYEECDSFELEDGYEKVAIYASASGVPTHAARQLSSGRWASKLGKFVDVHHARLEGVMGGEGLADYGSPVLAMRRPKSDASP